jgi:neutral trehalase
VLLLHDSANRTKEDLPPVARKELPRVQFYDHDLIDMYDQTWTWTRDFWKKGTAENGFQSRYFSRPDSKRINSFEDTLATFFLVYSNRLFPVMPSLDNFYAKQEEDGAIRGEYSERNGKPVPNRANPEGVLPPLYAFAEYNIYHKIGSKKRIKDVVPKLQRHYEWVERVFRAPNGLYSVPLAATMMENSPRHDMVYPVDFNSQMALSALYISYLADLLNDKEVSYHYKKAYFSLKTRISSLMWSDEDGYYYDLDKQERRIPLKTIASFWPLLAQIPNEERSEALIAHLSDPKHFGMENPFPTLAACEKSFNPQGGGFRGSVYPEFTYFVLKGLERNNRFDLAREFALRHLYYLLDGLHPDNGKQGTLWEAYLPAREGPAKWTENRKFPRSRHIGTAALSTVAVMIENVVGLNVSLPRKTVDWVIPTRELMGIEDLALKRNTISILCNKSSRGWEIDLESEKLYYLTVNMLNDKKKTLPIPSGKCSILLDKI